MNLPKTKAQEIAERYLPRLNDPSIDMDVVELRGAVREITAVLKTPDAPGRGDLYLLLSEVYGRLGLPRERLDAAKNASHTDRLSPRYANSVGRALGLLNRHREALGYLDRAARNLHRSNAPDLAVTVTLNQSSAHFALGEPLEGEAALRRAMQLVPEGHVLANLHVASVLAVFGPPDEALEYLARHLAAARGVPRGDAPAFDVILASPPEMVARLRTELHFDRVIADAERRSLVAEAAPTQTDDASLPAPPTESELARAVEEARDEDGSVNPYALALALAAPGISGPSDERSFRFAGDAQMLRLLNNDG